MSSEYNPVGSKCLGQCQPGTRILRDAIDDFWAQAYDVGCYNCRQTRGSGTLSVHAEGRADDTGLPNVSYGQPIADWLVKNHDALSIQLVIYNRQIWNVSRISEGWRPYHGVDPHTGHIHWEHNWHGAKTLTRAEVDAVKPGGQPSPPPGQEEDDVPQAIVTGADNDPKKKGLWLTDGKTKRWIQNQEDVDFASKFTTKPGFDISPEQLDRIPAVPPYPGDYSGPKVSE